MTNSCLVGQTAGIEFYFEYEGSQYFYDTNHGGLYVLILYKTYIFWHILNITWKKKSAKKIELVVLTIIRLYDMYY